MAVTPKGWFSARTGLATRSDFDGALDKADDGLRLHPVVYHDPSTRANGAITAGDEMDGGRLLNNTGVKVLKYVSGRIAHDPAASSGSTSAGYIQFDTRGSTSGAPSAAAADQVRDIRCQCAWDANALGAVAIVAPSASGGATWIGGTGPLPAAGFHAAFYGNGVWSLGVWNPGTTVGYANGGINHSIQPGTATTFTLTVQTTIPAATNTTANISLGATAAQVKAAIEALANVGAGGVAVVKSPSGNYGITWATALGAVTLTATVTGTGSMGMAAPLPTNPTNTIADIVTYSTGVTTYGDYTTVRRYGTVWDSQLRWLEVFIDPETDQCNIIFPDGTASGPIYHPGIGLWTASRGVFELFENNSGQVDVPATIGKFTVNSGKIPYGSPVTPKSEIANLIKALVINGWDYASAAAAGGTTVLTANSAIIQQITANSTNGQTFTLPASLPAGSKMFFFTNNSNGLMTINASNGSLVTILASGNTALFFAFSSTPTTPGAWVNVPIVTLAGVQSVVSKTFTLSNWVKSLNAQTGTTYTLVLTDHGKIVTMNNAAGNTLTVPPNSSVAFAVGDEIEIIQIGAGQTTVAAGSGVTILATPGLKIAGQGGRARATKIATDTWVVSGDLTT